MPLVHRVDPTPAAAVPPSVELTRNAPSVSIGPCRQIDLIAAFLRDTSIDDRYRRFGNGGIATVDWLVERMQANRSRGAYAVESGGKLIGVLDYVVMHEELEFGVLVHSSRRREGIASSLVRLFFDGISRLHPGARIVAYCDFDNRAATRLLRASGMRATSRDCDWMRFEKVVDAQCTNHAEASSALCA